MKNLAALDIVAVIGLITYNVLMFGGVLRFGREMGDLGYYAILFFGTLTILLFYVLKYRRIWKRKTRIITILAFVLLIFIFYQSSFGRGPDFPWNGFFFE